MSEDFKPENLGKIVQQAQAQTQKLTSQIEKTQEALAHTQATGEAGAGAVKITMNGRYETLKVSIDPKLFETPEVITTLVAAAANHAVEKVQKISQKMIVNLAGSMELPKQLQDALKDHGEP